MTTGLDVVECARTYVGSPWVHQGRIKGRAIDCIGLITCVAQELGLYEGVFDEPYGRTPDGHRLAREFDARGECLWKGDHVPIDKFQPGDILLMAWRVYPMHCAFLAPGNECWHIIHSYGDVGRVCEHPITDLWRSRTKAVYRFKGLT